MPPELRPARFVVVLPLQPLADDAAFTLRQWPLHLTVVPTFSIAAGLDPVIAAIDPLLDDASAIALRAGAEEGFGRANRRPASLIDRSERLVSLHDALCAAVRGQGAQFDHPEFTGVGYRPHVTKTRFAGVSEGEMLDLRQAAVVDMAPLGDRRLRRVVWIRNLL